MDLETVDAATFARSLTGIGVNLLCRDVRATAAFLQGCFGVSVHRLSADFAIVRCGDALIQLHSDASYSAHPMHDLLPETPPRGVGAQVFLFGIDPDTACNRAEAVGGTVIEAPRNKPHGLREATILSPDGYAFSPAVHAA
jgi:predicted enzyme related to lactoylglutathione lyase